jgi:hypothetical protein
MTKTRFLLVAAISTVVSGAVGMALSPGISDFGPGVADDATLNASVAVLQQQIAWLNKPESDAFRIARSVTADKFNDVVTSSNPSDLQGRFASISDDKTLNDSLGALSILIAWQNSPASDTYMIADSAPAVRDADFQRLALASVSAINKHVIE